MDVIVKGELIPVFRHFQKPVAFQKVPDNPRFAGCRLPEAVGQFKLTSVIAVSPYQVLHYFNKDPGRVNPQILVCAAHHFVAERAQSV